MYDDSRDQTSLLYFLYGLGKEGLFFMARRKKTEKKIEDNTDPFDKARVLQQLMSIEREYNKTKEQFYYKAQSYFRQGISSNFTKMKDLKDLINKCETLRKRYMNYKESVTKATGTDRII